MLQIHYLNIKLFINKHDTDGVDNRDQRMIDLFLVRRNLIGSVCDVWSRRGLAGGLSDLVVVICRLAFCCTWYRTRNVNKKKSEG